MRSIIAALASLFLFAQPASAGYYSMTVNGVERTLYMDLPFGYRSTDSYPVIIMLHGGNGDGLKIAGTTELSKYTKRNKIVAVYPNALPNAGDTAWHDGREFTGGSDPSDVDFLSAVVDAVVRNYGRDPSRVYLGGSSSGGIMTLRMMCERTSKFRAYTVNIAGMAAGMACDPTGPAPLNIYASPDDPLMPYAGGTVNPNRGLVISHQATVDFWAIKNGCVVAPTVTNLPQIVNDGTSIVLTSYGTCGLDDYRVNGGGHSWPGAAKDAIFGVTTQNLDGTQKMIDFFSRFGL